MKKTYDISAENRFRVFQVSYIPQSNYRPSRIKIKDLRNNKSIILSKDPEFRDGDDQALNHLEKLGITVDALGLSGGSYYLLLSRNTEIALTK